jgi:transcriptional regulator with XRE-family HTH domain
VTPNGTAIRAIRTAKNLGLRTLASSTGIDRGYLSRLERGLIRKPAEERLLRIAEELEVPPAAITHEEKT